MEAIPDEEITVFKDANGEVVDYPTFLDKWETLIPHQTEEAAAEVGGPLKNALTRFVQRKRREFRFRWRRSNRRRHGCS